MRFDPITPQEFDVVSTGVRLDSLLAIAPPKERIETAARKAGLPWQATVKTDGGISISSYDLGLDTEIETEQWGATTLRQILETGKIQLHSKLRCQSPFRDSSSYAAFLTLAPDGRPFVYDSGTETKHQLNDREWTMQRTLASPVGVEATPLFDIESYRVDRFLGKEPVPRRWLITDVLPAGKVGVLVAPGGTGKSIFLLHVGVGVATGAPAFGIWETDEIGGVLMLLAEDDDEEIHRRIHYIIRQLAASNNHESIEAMLKNLIIKSMVAENNLMTETNTSREVQQTNYVERLIATAELVPNLKLIVIDPASRFRGGEENSAQDTTRFVEALERVAHATGATVLFAHHTNKASSNADEPSQNASRGSSALTDGVRWQMNLAGITKTEAQNYAIPTEERRSYLIATNTKNNYALPQQALILKRGEGGCLYHVALTSNKEKQAEDLKSKIVRLVAEETKAGQLYSKTSFEEKFGGTDKALGVGKNTVRDLLKKLVATNKLSVQNGKLVLPQRAKVAVGAT